MIKTPLLESTKLSKVANAKVLLKMEAMQPSGSFKDRGIGYLCHHYARQGAKTFISSSGGNAGLAVCYAGKKLGIAVKVVVPETTTRFMIEKLLLENAEVIIHGNTWDEADVYARSLLHDTSCYYIPPFDHPLIWEGHSTIVDEFAIKPEAIVLAVGGGGLLCGVLQGLHRRGWQDVPIIAVETEGSDSFAECFRQKKWVKKEKIDSIATSLGAKQVTEEAFHWIAKHEIIPVVVSDREAVQACDFFLDDMRIMVEPACGAALSLVYQKNSILTRFTSVCVIVCGGNNVSQSLLNEWKEKLRL